MIDINAAAKLCSERTEVTDIVTGDWVMVNGHIDGIKQGWKVCRVAERVLAAPGRMILSTDLGIIGPISSNTWLFRVDPKMVEEWVGALGRLSVATRMEYS